MSDFLQHPLVGLWYLAAHAGEIAPGKMIRRILFEEPLVLGRTQDGAVFAFVDVCPHRGAPLSEGCLAGDAVECPYHSWRFAVDTGACVEVPALPTPEERSKNIGLKKRHLEERNDLLWLYHGDGEMPKEPPPNLGIDPAIRPKTKTCLTVTCDFDEAVIGLVDPAHTPTVHQQWWWRKGAARALKTKNFEPTARGFRMPPHPPSSNSRIYKMLGGAPTTEIEFRLPGLRLEWIRNDKRLVFGFTAMTPGDKGQVRINHFIFWDSALFNLVTPLAQKMSNDFFGQDKAILEAQHKNLSRDAHRPLFLGDPDVPAQWYCQLKKAWAEQGHGFENPLSAATLKWRT